MSKKTILGVGFVLLIAVTTASVVFVILPSRGAPATNPSEFVPEPPSTQKLNSDVVRILQSDEETVDFINQQKQGNKIVHEVPSINWNDQKLVALSYSLAAGQTVENAAFNSTIFKISVRQAPEGCAFPAVMYDHMSIIPVKKIEDTSNYSSVAAFLKNDKKCEINS